MLWCQVAQNIGLRYSTLTLKLRKLYLMITIIHVRPSQPARQTDRRANIWWRSQKLCVRGADPNAGDARVEASKATSGVGSGKGCPLPSRLGTLGERRELASEVSGKAPVANAFSVYSRPQNAFREKKKKHHSQLSSAA